MAKAKTVAEIEQTPEVQAYDVGRADGIGAGITEGRKQVLDLVHMVSIRSETYGTGVGTQSVVEAITWLTENGCTCSTAPAYDDREAFLTAGQPAPDEPQADIDIDPLST